MRVRIGTRKSMLALAQSRWVKTRIEEAHPQVTVELVTISTRGDKILDSPLSEIGGKGLFVKEIEEAMLRGQIDAAVHSMKDVPAEVPEGLALCAFPERENPFDALVSVDGSCLEELPPGARVGTGSLRRKAQLLHVRPDLTIVPLRGNVDTRLGKLDSGSLHALVLAAAGLRRLGRAHRISHVLPPAQLLPAVCQGTLGLEVRESDHDVAALLAFLNHPPTETAVTAERAVLKELEGGCQVPIAAFAVTRGDSVHVEAMVGELDGSRLVRDSLSGEARRAGELGVALAGRLLSSGADEILARVYGGGGM